VRSLVIKDFKVHRHQIFCRVCSSNTHKQKLILRKCKWTLDGQTKNLKGNQQCKIDLKCQREEFQREKKLQTKLRVIFLGT